MLTESLAVLGIALIGHSVFSAREFFQFTKLNESKLPLPRDIIQECALGCIIVVLWYYSTLKFKPGDPKVAASELEQAGTPPYYTLETRPNFQDIKTKRAEYLKWKQGNQ